MNITATHYFDIVRIRFDGKLHVAFVKSKFVGLESWMEGPGKYVIEYTFTEGATMYCEYDTEEHWLQLLNELDGIL